MISNKPFEQSNNFADDIAKSADQAKKLTSNVPGDALGSLNGTVQGIRQQAAPILNQAGALAQRGVDTVRETSQQLQEKALRASDNTVRYIKDEPVKSMLIATAIGAGLMALVSLMSRSRERS